jgi:hypothetical protein
MAIVTMPNTSVLDGAVKVDIQYDNAGAPPWPVVAVVVGNTTPYIADFIITRYRANGTVQNEDTRSLAPNTPHGTVVSVPGNRYTYSVTPEGDLIQNFSTQFTGLRPVS